MFTFEPLIPAGNTYPRTHPDRSIAMSLMHEALARAQHSERLDEAEHVRRRLRYLAAAKAQRRAERAASRARRLSALADLPA